MSHSPSLAFGPSWCVSSNIFDEAQSTDNRHRMRQQPSRQQSNDSSSNGWGSGHPHVNGGSNGSNGVGGGSDHQYQPQPPQYEEQHQHQHQHQHQQQQGTSNPPRISYSLEELLEICHQIERSLQAVPIEERFRSLEPIQQLIGQVKKESLIQQKINNGGNSNDNPKVAELSAKLDELNPWAHDERSGLDFNSLLSTLKNKNQSQQAQSQNENPGHSFFNSMAPQQQSQFVTPLQRGSSFNSLSSPMTNGSSGQGYNAFLSDGEEHLLQPAEIKWEYLDGQGNEQGPFNSPMMQEWLQCGYLQNDLRLRRVGSTMYTSLGDLISAWKTPFLVSMEALPNDPAPVAATSTSQSYSNMGFEPQTSRFMTPSFSQHATPQLPQLYTAQQQSRMFPSDHHSGASSPWASQSNLATPTLSNNLQDFNISGGLGNQATFLSNFQDNTSVTATAGNSFLNHHEDDMFSEIHSQVLNNVLGDDGHDVVPIAHTPVNEVPYVIPQAHETVPAAVAEQLPVQVPVPTTQSNKKSVKSQETPKKKQTKSKSVTQTKTIETVKPIVEVKPVQIKPVLQTKPVEAKPKPILAPWATKQPTTSTTPALSLQEIRSQAAQEHKAAQMKLKVESERFATAQMIAEAQKLEAPAKSALAATSSWGTDAAPKRVAPTKSLLDIQREEVAAAAAAAASASAQSTQSSTSFANVALTPGSMSSSNANPWTTVAKKVVTAPKSKAPMTTNSVKQVTPEMLRSISTQSTNVAVKQTAASSARAGGNSRQEFLTWCRSTMKLNKGMKVDSILEFILELPYTQDSSELIADTIYSNSSTMDGRRFAQEFMKRRKGAEAQTNDGLRWSDALMMVNADDDDGWGFQVVQKKGKKKLQH